MWCSASRSSASTRSARRRTPTGRSTGPTTTSTRRSSKLPARRSTRDSGVAAHVVDDGEQRALRRGAFSRVHAAQADLVHFLGERHELRPERAAFRCEVHVDVRSEEHTSELQSPCNLVCRLLLEKKK